MTNDSEDWKEKKFQEKIVQLLDLVNIDFYQNIFENAEGKGLPDVKDEKFIKIRAEYPTSFGDVGSRPDIYVETNKGKCFVFELKPDKYYDEQQLINHDTNMKEWVAHNNKQYLATILIANLDSEHDDIEFSEKDIKWIGWDIIYRALEDLKINKLDPDIRSNIDKIFKEVPLAKLSTILKQSLLGEAEESELFNALKLSVLVTELRDQLHTQMGLEDILKKYEPISGNETHKIFSDKANVLFKSVEKAFRSEFENYEHAIKIETGEYLDRFELILTDWAGFIDVDFRALKNQSKDRIDLILRLRSGKKYSLLKTLVTLYDENRTQFDDLLQGLTDEGIEVFAQFGGGEKIDIPAKEGMEQVRDRTYMPVYAKKGIPVFNKERDTINNNVIETTKILLRTFKTLFDKFKGTASSEEIEKDLKEAEAEEIKTD